MRVLEKAEGTVIGAEDVRWSWPIAARAARALEDRQALDTVLAVLDARPVGHKPPVLRAQRQLFGGLLQADTDPHPTAADIAPVANAVEALRAVGNPYQFAHGLIDLADVMARVGSTGMDAPLEEARSIAGRLGCPPLLEQVALVQSRSAFRDSSVP